MNETEALARMVAPGTRRPGKYREGVIQIWVTRVCDKACYSCTQGSQLTHPKDSHNDTEKFITLEHFEQACQSLKGYFGVVGVFGGNPCMHPKFPEICEILKRYFPREQRGLWSNHPVIPEHAKAARACFDPAVSNLNVHLDRKAYDMFKQYWPECSPVGLERDSRHSPCYVAMKDVLKTTCLKCGGLGDDNIKFQNNSCSECKGTGKVYDESRAWELISNCDINQDWSAMIGVFRGKLRAWFCEIAGAQAMLHQWDKAWAENERPNGVPGYDYTYPDTGVLIFKDGSGYVTTEAPQKGSTAYSQSWWELPMQSFTNQVRQHCHDCGVPLRGHGQLAQGSEKQEEQVSETHRDIYITKRRRPLQIVTEVSQLGAPLESTVKYLQNASK